MVGVFQRQIFKQDRFVGDLMVIVCHNAGFQAICYIYPDQFQFGVVLRPAVEPVFTADDVGYDGLICINARQIEIDIKILQGKRPVLIGVTAMNDPDGNCAFLAKIADPPLFQKLLLLAAAGMLHGEAELVAVGYIQIYLSCQSAAVPAAFGPDRF